MHDQNKNIQKEIKRNQHILYEDGQIYIHYITKHWYGRFNIIKYLFNKGAHASNLAL